jgi:hypothetical protein
LVRVNVVSLLWSNRAVRAVIEAFSVSAWPSSEEAWWKVKLAVSSIICEPVVVVVVEVRLVDVVDGLVVVVPVPVEVVDVDAVDVETVDVVDVLVVVVLVELVVEEVVLPSHRLL